jgi:DNA invertase Pin-like site-specific DNA recombinase
LPLLVTGTAWPVHILAAVAEHEREMISERTKAALQAAKARGVRLGNPQLAKAAKRGAAAVRANARQFAVNVLPIIEEIEHLRGQYQDNSFPTARSG